MEVFKIYKILFSKLKFKQSMLCLCFKNVSHVYHECCRRTRKDRQWRKQKYPPRELFIILRCACICINTYTYFITARSYCIYHYDLFFFPPNNIVFTFLYTSNFFHHYSKCLFLFFFSSIKYLYRVYYVSGKVQVALQVLIRFI